MKVRNYLFKNKLSLFFIIFTSIIISISEILMALSMKESLDMIINFDFNNMRLVISIFILVFILSILGYYFNGIASAYYKRNILSSIRYDLAHSIMQMNLIQFQSQKSGDISSALTSNINQIETKFLDIIIKMIRQSTSFILASITILYFSPKLTISLYAFIIVLMFAPHKTHKKMQELGLNFSSTIGSYSTKIQELVGGFETIKAFRATEKFDKELDILNKECEQARYQIGKKESRILSILAGLSLLTFYVPFFIGVIFISKGYIEPGVLMAITNLSGSIINPIQQFGTNMASLKIGEGILKSMLNDLIDIDENNSSTNNNADKCSKIDVTDGITIENLYFSYQDHPVVSNLSLFFKNKKKYLLMGASGSGKSTILKLLLGFYDNYSGSIKIDDIEIRDINDNDFYKLIAYIPQKTFILNGTIRENIVFNSYHDEEKLKSVCSKAMLNDIIDELPNELDTFIGDGARQLSGGQMQRISIARALYSDAKILLIDEATSSLDEENSYKINDIILNLDQLVINVLHKISDDQAQKYDDIFEIKESLNHFV